MYCLVPTAPLGSTSYSGCPTCDAAIPSNEVTVWAIDHEVKNTKSRVRIPDLVIDESVSADYSSAVRFQGLGESAHHSARLKIRKILSVCLRTSTEVLLGRLVWGARGGEPRAPGRARRAVQP